MKTLISSLRSLPVLALAFSLVASQTRAGSYINWGGDTVSVTTNLQGDTGTYLSGSDKYGDPNGSTTGPSTVGRFFDKDTAFSPTSNYTGPLFYGGGSVTNETGTNEGFHELKVANQGTTDGLQWQVDSASGDHHTNHLFIYFKQADFDPAYNSGTLSLDPGSAFALHTDQVTGSAGSGVDLRWVVQNSGQFYISQNVTSLSSNTSYLTNLADITGWATYAPTNASFAGLDFDPTFATWLTPAFSNLEGLGFYVEHENPLGATQATHVDVASFAVSVPEPSRMILAAAGLISLVLRRRRHAD